MEDTKILFRVRGKQAAVENNAGRISR